VQFAQVRATFDIVGRLLGEMKATPGAKAGKTLLDETLWCSFPISRAPGRRGGPTSDNWPHTPSSSRAAASTPTDDRRYNIGADPTLPGSRACRCRCRK